MKKALRASILTCETCWMLLRPAMLFGLGENKVVVQRRENNKTTKEDLVRERGKFLVRVGRYQLIMEFAELGVTDSGDPNSSVPHKLEGVNVELLRVILALKIDDVDFQQPHGLMGPAG